MQAAEDFCLRRLVDEGHRPLGKLQAFERRLADLSLNVNQRIPYPVNVVIHTGILRADRDGCH